MDFFDVIGASGTAYRFRRATLDQLPATAGNLVVVTGTPPRLRYRMCASTRSLASAAPTARQALAGVRGGRVLIRLNVARATREAEHVDIVEGQSPDAVVSDLD